MDKRSELLLKERAATLEDVIQTIDYEIERAVHAVAAATFDAGHAIGVVHDRRNVQLGYMYDLGKVAAQIGDLENRIREEDERDRERQAVEGWQAEIPVTEDHLDWLRPALNAPEIDHDSARDDRHRHREPEDRMLAEMHREDADLDNQLDWWLKR